MQIITDANTFNSERLILVTNAKQAWAHATLLSVSAVMHYQSDKEAKDSSWIESLMNSFLECDSRMCQAFEAFVKASTNVKFRQDPEALDKALTTKVVGVTPSNWTEVIEVVKVQGLNRFAKIKTKSKAQAERWNNDFNKVDKPKKPSDSAADITHLSTTPLGSSLVEAVTGTDALTEEQKAQLDQAAKAFSDFAKAVKSGTSADVPAFMADDVPSDVLAYMNETMTKMTEVYRCKGSEKTMKMLHNLNTQADQAIQSALAKLAAA